MQFNVPLSWIQRIEEIQFVNQTKVSLEKYGYIRRIKGFTPPLDWFPILTGANEVYFRNLHPLSSPAHQYLEVGEASSSISLSQQEDQPGPGLTDQKPYLRDFRHATRSRWSPITSRGSWPVPGAISCGCCCCWRLPLH